jgi:flagellin
MSTPSSVLNTNIASMIARRNLGTAQTRLSESVERLSSGTLINRAKDDAAGMAVAAVVDTQVKVASTAHRNINDAISMVQTAEGALQEATSTLTRIKELATQGANDSMSRDQYYFLVQEMRQLMHELANTAERTTFNGNKLLGTSPHATRQVTTTSTTTQTTGVAQNTWTAVDSSGLLTGMTGTIRVIAEVTGGTVKLDTVPAGVNATITGYGNATNGSATSIAFEGSVADVSAALAGLKAQRTGAGAAQVELDAVPSPSPVSWADLQCQSNNAQGGVTVTGITNIGGTPTNIMISTDRLPAFVQTNGGTNYFIPSTPYISGFTQGPTGSDIIAFEKAGNVNISSAGDPKIFTLAFVSTDLNTYRFENEFDILSQADSPGYWGSGSAEKRVSNVNGKIFYDLVTSAGNPHGVLLFKDPLTSLKFSILVDENWNGVNVGVVSLRNKSVTLSAPQTVTNTVTTTTTEPATIEFNDWQFLSGAGKDDAIRLDGIPIWDTAQSAAARNNGAGYADGAVKVGALSALYQRILWLSDPANSQLETGNGYDIFSKNAESIDGAPDQQIFNGSGELISALTKSLNELVDDSILQINAHRSYFGSYAGRMEHNIANLAALSENLTAAGSRIRDTDYGAETAALTRTQILQQAATAMLAQANAMPNVVLALLRQQ